MTITRTKPLFLGYAVFYDGKPFPCSGNTVTMDKVYLKASALCKLNRLSKEAFARLDDVNEINWVKVHFRKDRKLTLRRVYAH